MTAECIVWPDWVVARVGGGNYYSKALLGQLARFEYDCVLDSGIVSVLHFLNSVIGLWLCKRMSFLLGSTHSTM